MNCLVNCLAPGLHYNYATVTDIPTYVTCLQAKFGVDVLSGTSMYLSVTFV